MILHLVEFQPLHLNFFIHQPSKLRRPIPAVHVVAVAADGQAIRIVRLHGHGTFVGHLRMESLIGIQSCNEVRRSVKTTGFDLSSEKNVFQPNCTGKVTVQLNTTRLRVTFLEHVKTSLQHVGKKIRKKIRRSKKTPHRLTTHLPAAPFLREYLAVSWCDNPRRSP